MAVLEVNNIEKHFGSTRVLKDVSFSLEKGQCTVDYRVIGLLVRQHCSAA